MNTLRPDEKAALKHIETAKSNEGLVKQGIGLAAGFAGANKILPLLNEFVPSSLALQGLKKVDKRIGTFIDKTLENGFSGESVLGFLRDQFGQKTSEPTQTSKETQPLHPLQEFEQTYPDIAQAMSNLINQGQSPQAAAAILKQSTPFSSKIKRLEKDVGKNFVDYVLELMGGNAGQMQQPSAQQQVAQPQAQQMEPQQSRGSADEALLAALDKILKM